MVVASYSAAGRHFYIIIVTKFYSYSGNTRAVGMGSFHCGQNVTIVLAL